MVKLVEVKDVSFSYDKDSPIVFENISFSIEKGDVLCILGPNGTGKTTLIKTINGLHEVNSGSISLNGTHAFVFGNENAKKHTRYEKFVPKGTMGSFSSPFLFSFLNGPEAIRWAEEGGPPYLVPSAGVGQPQWPRGGCWSLS